MNNHLFAFLAWISCCFCSIQATEPSSHTLATPYATQREALVPIYKQEKILAKQLHDTLNNAKGAKLMCWALWCKVASFCLDYRTYPYVDADGYSTQWINQPYLSDLVARAQPNSLEEQMLIRIIGYQKADGTQYELPTMFSFHITRSGCYALLIAPRTSNMWLDIDKALVVPANPYLSNFDTTSNQHTTIFTWHYDNDNYAVFTSSPYTLTYRLLSGQSITSDYCQGKTAIKQFIAGCYRDRRSSLGMVAILACISAFLCRRLALVHVYDGCWVMFMLSLVWFFRLEDTTLFHILAFLCIMLYYSYFQALLLDYVFGLGEVSTENIQTARLLLINFGIYSVCTWVVATYLLVTPPPADVDDHQCSIPNQYPHLSLPL